ncbi:MAG TPA: AAA family ATPase, partial [Planctomycetaceae bacterium]|nr:AAA family ATPase [Planctomycetaceae bacterium]
MSFDLFIDGIKNFLDRSTSELAAFIVGFIVGIVTLLSPWLYRKIFGRSAEDSEKATLTERCEKLEAEKRNIQSEADSRATQIDDLTAALETKQDELNAKTEEAETLADEKRTLRDDLDQLNAQLEKLTQLDGDIWQRPPNPEQVPRFRTLSHGKPPIIAVVNLKGGVGKTTITANLAAAAMHLGRNPLLVDLDYQNSLSALTLSRQLREDISEKGHFVSELISSPEPTGEDVIRLAQRINDKDGFVIATNEDLTTIETQVMAQWITNATSDDVRFRLRRALHSDKVQSKYDLILIDCPPRLTTACVNALACCDYVLI